MTSPMAIMLLLLLLCLSSLFPGTLLLDQDRVQLKISAVMSQSIINMKPAVRSFVQCRIVDSVVYWLNEVLMVDACSSHSLPYNRQCSRGYYYKDNDVSSSQRYCHESCVNETKCGPVTIPEQHLKPCSVCNTRGECHTENQTWYQPENGNQTWYQPENENQTWYQPKNGNQTDYTLDRFNNAHYILYVSAIPNTVECKLLGRVVSAGTCLQDKNTDRPVAGYLNFCPRHLDGRHSFYRMSSYVLREMIGALGFSESLLPFYRDSNGNPLMPRGPDGLPRRDIHGRFRVDYVISKTFVYNNWRNARPVEEHKVKMITLPKVAIEASKHFGCPNMTGMLLEDQYPGKLLWESRIFWGELMTSSWDNWKDSKWNDYQEPVVSRITLALLQDTGWYYPRYKYGFTVHWGKGKGCSFVNQSCLDWIKKAMKNKQRVSPFCVPGNRQPVKGCTSDHTHVTTCSFMNYSSSIDRQFRYWKFSSQFGGNVPSMDYCPFYNLVGKDGVDCTISKQRTGHEAASDNYFGGAKCVETSKPWKVYNATSKKRYRETEWGAGCYKIECKNDGRFFVSIGDLQVECNKTGQLIPVDKVFIGPIRYSGGEIICPSYEQMCLLHICSNKCLYGGQCYPKKRFKCYCPVGFEGLNCYFDAGYFYREDKPTCTNEQYHGQFEEIT